MPDIQVDLLTDVRCPFSFISQMNLQAAVQKLGLPLSTRYHKIHDMTVSIFKWKDAVVLNRTEPDSEARLCGGPLPPSFPESKRAEGGEVSMWRDVEGCGDPSIAQEGENLDDYLFREFGYSKEPSMKHETTIHNMMSKCEVYVNVLGQFDI